MRGRALLVLLRRLRRMPARFVAAFLLAAALTGEPSYGQDGPSLAPGKAFTQYVHDAWQVSEGLPQNTVRAVLQTRDGYLWLGTQEGLVRFDGVRFTVFDRTNTEGLGASDIIALFEDRSGGLWIGTHGGGLTLLRDGRFTTYTRAQGLPRDEVYAITEDQAGALWIGTVGGGLTRFEGGTFTTFTTEDGLPSNTVLALEEDLQGRLWIGMDGGLAVLHDGRFTAYGEAEGLAESVVRVVHRDRRGALWVGTEDRLVRFAEGRFTSFGVAEGLSDPDVTTIYEDRAGTLWIGTLAGGVCRRSGERFSCYTTAEGLTHDNIRALYEDREGSLWIGTDGGGLNRLRDGKFTVFSAAEGLTHNTVYSVSEGPSGVLWIGTEGGGLNRLHEGRLGSVQGAEELSGEFVLSVLERRDGSLWVGTNGGGLYRVVGGRLARYTTSEGLPDNTVRALYESRDGRLWIGTEGGLAVLDGSGIRTYARADGLPNEVVVSLLEDRAGALWVGTFGGLARLEGDRFTSFSSRSGLLSDVILALHEDAEGVLWIATYGGGLSRYRDGRFTAYTTKDGLVSDNLVQVLEDEAGYLWLGSNKGIFRVEKAQLHRIAEGEAALIRTMVYGEEDGLKSSECNGGVQPAAWRSRDGRLWFSTLEGVAVVDPRRMPRNVVAPPVVIERFAAGGRDVPLAGSLRLPAGSDDFEFHYTGLSLLAPHRVRFRYRLEGQDGAWHDATDRRSAFYTNLPPGTYTFRVQAANDEGLWNETGTAVSFYVAPFFYQTYWFYGLCVLGLVLLATGAHRVRIRQLKAREQELVRLVNARTHDLSEEKERVEQSKAVIEAQARQLREMDEMKTRFFSSISHELRTPLALTITPLERALAGAYGPVESRFRTQIEIMLRNVRRLLRLINQLLDVARLEAGQAELRARRMDLVSFMEHLALPFARFAEQKGIDFRFIPGEPQLEVYFEPDKLEKVFYNLLSNALKFTGPGGTVRMTVARRAAFGADGAGAQAEVCVSDTGPGIAEDALACLFDRFKKVRGGPAKEREGSGLGLKLAKELVELHGGTIGAESQPGAGSTFAVRLPLGRAHLAEAQVTTEREDDSPGRRLRAAQELEVLREAPDPAADVPPGGDGAPLQAPLVLVVEDDPLMRRYVVQCLKDSYRTLEAVNGEDGLDQARQHVPDLILSDLMMPLVDGYELCRQVRSDPRLSHIPIILLTARASDEDMVEGLEAADDYMVKPFNRKELLARIHNLIKLRRQEGQLRMLNDVLQLRVREQLDTILRGKRLNKYLPEQLVHQVLSSDAEVEVASERKLVTVFFSDLTGFTTLSESVPPEQITWLLNDYLTEMVQLINEYGGTLDKFMGDGLMAFFGAPYDMEPESQARNAVAMAFAMQHRIARLADHWRRQGIEHDVRVRMGIHQDHVTVGNFGSAELLQYTVIGRGVNLAKRMESACAPGKVMVGARVYACLTGAYRNGLPQEHTFKGIARPVDVWELDPAVQEEVST